MYIYIYLQFHKVDAILDTCEHVSIYLNRFTSLHHGTCPQVHSEKNKNGCFSTRSATKAKYAYEYVVFSIPVPEN